MAKRSQGKKTSPLSKAVVKADTVQLTPKEIADLHAKGDSEIVGYGDVKREEDWPSLKIEGAAMESNEKFVALYNAVVEKYNAASKQGAPRKLPDLVKIRTKIRQSNPHIDEFAKLYPLIFVAFTNPANAPQKLHDIISYVRLHSAVRYGLIPESQADLILKMSHTIQKEEYDALLQRSMAAAKAAAPATVSDPPKDASDPFMTT